MLEADQSRVEDEPPSVAACKIYGKEILITGPSGRLKLLNYEGVILTMILLYINSCCFMLGIS